MTEKLRNTTVCYCNGILFFMHQLFLSVKSIKPAPATWLASAVKPQGFIHTICITFVSKQSWGHLLMHDFGQLMEMCDSGFKSTGFTLSQHSRQREKETSNPSTVLTLKSGHLCDSDLGGIICEFTEWMLWTFVNQTHCNRITRPVLFQRQQMQPRLGSNMLSFGKHFWCILNAFKYF